MIFKKFHESISRTNEFLALTEEIFGAKLSIHERYQQIDEEGESELVFVAPETQDAEKCIKIKVKSRGR